MRLILHMMLVQAMFGCDCETQSVAQARKHAGIVFRGTIVAFHDSAPSVDPAGVTHTWRVAVFQVTRVWKGDVPTACVGFWPTHLKVGTDLLVYASRIDQDYVTDICTRTALASKTKDFPILGPGRAPK